MLALSMVATTDTLPSYGAVVEQPGEEGGHPGETQEQQVLPCEQPQALHVAECDGVQPDEQEDEARAYGKGRVAAHVLHPELGEYRSGPREHHGDQREKDRAFHLTKVGIAQLFIHPKWKSTLRLITRPSIGAQSGANAGREGVPDTISSQRVRRVSLTFSPFSTMFQRPEV